MVVMVPEKQEAMEESINSAHVNPSGGSIARIIRLKTQTGLRRDNL